MQRPALESRIQLVMVGKQLPDNLALMTAFQAKYPGALRVMAPVPLSNAECTGLGGKVVDVVHGCGSGKVCYTTDKNGVIHHACITKQ